MLIRYPMKCRLCGRTIQRADQHRARGLHHHCYARERTAGRLDQYPPLRRRVDHDQLAALEAQGLPTATIAARFDVSPSAIRTARCRARRAAHRIVS